MSLRSISRWLRTMLIADVPEDIALCEFDCSKKQCRTGEWETCERRIKTLQTTQQPGKPHI